MIQDQQFWVSVREDPKNDRLFRCLLARLDRSQQQQAAAAVASTTRTLATSPSSPRPPSTRVTPGGGSPVPTHEPFAETPSTRIGGGSSAGTASKLPKLAVSEATLRLLQHTMLFVAPVRKLRYSVPALSLSWLSSCCIDGATQRFVTFGASKPAQVPDHLRFKACVAGDTYFAALTDNGEVWISGSLDGPANIGANLTPSSSGATRGQGSVENMRGVCGKTMQMCGHGGRLFGLTTAFTMRPISAVSAGTRSLIPYRLVQYVDCGFGEDLYMVGVDSTIYKTTASSRSTGTPRRIMTFSRICVSRVAAGTGTLAVIDQGGQLYTMGRNKFGQVGNGQKQDSIRRPVLQTSLTNHFFTMASVGEKHTLALTSSGIVYGCGSNESGQLGLGEPVKEALRFTKIPLPSLCVGIAAGPAGSMFACADGKLYCCGANESQQLGIPYGVRAIYIPTAVPGVRSGVMTYVLENSQPSQFGSPSSAVERPTSPLQSPQSSFESSEVNRSAALGGAAATGSRSGSSSANRTGKTKEPVCGKCCSVS